MTVLATERLVLRPLRETDADALLGYIGEPEWARFISQGVVRDDPTPDDARAFIDRGLPREGRPVADFAIERQGEVIGTVHLVPVEGDPGMAELACLVARSHWAAGYAVEAARRIVAYAFDELSLARVFARADARNTRSVRAMEKLGLRREALLRSHRVDRTGERCDEVVYGVLREERA